MRSREFEAIFKAGLGYFSQKSSEPAEIEPQSPHTAKKSAKKSVNSQKPTQNLHLLNTIIEGALFP
jgi:hypothetical protein